MLQSRDHELWVGRFLGATLTVLKILEMELVFVFRTNPRRSSETRKIRRFLGEPSSFPFIRSLSFVYARPSPFLRFSRSYKGKVRRSQGILLPVSPKVVRDESCILNVACPILLSCTSTVISLSLFSILFLSIESIPDNIHVRLK